MSVCLQEVLSYKIVLSYHNPNNVKAAILILLTKYPGLDTLNFMELTLVLRACLSSDFFTLFTCPNFATKAKSVLRKKLHIHIIIISSTQYWLHKNSCCIWCKKNALLMEIRIEILWDNHDWMNEWMNESWDILTNLAKNRELGINITRHVPSSWIITLVNRNSENVYPH